MRLELISLENEMDTCPLQRYSDLIITKKRQSQGSREPQTYAPINSQIRGILNARVPFCGGQYNKFRAKSQ